MRSNERQQKRHSLAGDLPPAVAPRFPHGHSMPEKKAERKYFVLFFQLTLRQTGAAVVADRRRTAGGRQTVNKKESCQGEDRKRVARFLPFYLGATLEEGLKRLKNCLGESAGPKPYDAAVETLRRSFRRRQHVRTVRIRCDRPLHNCCNAHGILPC